MGEMPTTAEREEAIALIREIVSIADYDNFMYEDDLEKAIELVMNYRRRGK